MADYDSLRDLSVKAGDHVSAGRENELLRRVARMTGETAPGRRATAGGSSTSFTLETTAAGITVSVSAGKVFWHNQTFSVGISAFAAAAGNSEVWLALDSDSAPTKCEVKSGTSMTAQPNTPMERYFKLATITSNGTTAGITPNWTGGNYRWSSVFGWWS